MRIGSQSPSVAGYALVLTATAIWSGNFIVARVLSDSVPPVTLAFLRWTIAVAVAFPLSIRHMYRDFRVIRAHLGYLCLTSFLVVTMFNTLIYIAAHSSKVVNLSLITVSSPIFIVLFAHFFLKDSLTFRRIVGLISAISGVVLLVTRGNLSNLASLTFSHGDAWMVLAAAIFGAYSILARMRPVALSPMAFLCSTFILGLLFLIPWEIWELRNAPTIDLSSTAIAAIVYLGVGPSLLAFLCWNKAIMLMGPVHCAFAYYALPIFSGIEALALLGEPIGPLDLVSGMLILLGAIVATYK